MKYYWIKMTKQSIIPQPRPLISMPCRHKCHSLIHPTKIIQWKLMVWVGRRKITLIGNQVCTWLENSSSASSKGKIDVRAKNVPHQVRHESYIDSEDINQKYLQGYPHIQYELKCPNYTQSRYLVFGLDSVLRVIMGRHNLLHDCWTEYPWAYNIWV